MNRRNFLGTALKTSVVATAVTVVGNKFPPDPILKETPFVETALSSSPIVGETQIIIRGDVITQFVFDGNRWLEISRTKYESN